MLKKIILYGYIIYLNKCKGSFVFIDFFIRVVVNVYLYVFKRYCFGSEVVYNVNIMEIKYWN